MDGLVCYVEVCLLPCTFKTPLDLCSYTSTALYHMLPSAGPPQRVVALLEEECLRQVPLSGLRWER